MADLSSVELDLVNNVETAERLLRWMSERRPGGRLSIDTETGELPGNPREDAFSPWHGQLRMVQIGDAQHGWAIPWDEWKGVFYQAMKDYHDPIVCHNVAFEARWFALQSRWEVPWHQMHDTMFMAHITNPLGSGALKELTKRLVDSKAAYLQGMLDQTMTTNGWTWGTIPIDFQPYWAYAALDPVLTMKVDEELYPACAPGGPYAEAYELEMNVRRIVTQMEISGARIDLEYSQRKYDELIYYTDNIKAWAKTHYKVGMTSNIQLVRKFEEMGAVITSTTKSGAKSCDKFQLELLCIEGNADVKQLAAAVLSQRKADKMAGTYFKNFIEKAVDGFVHCSVKTIGARTSRMSITDPALQTLPKGDPTVRAAFIGRDEDHLIGSSDLDQVEFRIAGALSGDPALIDMFRRVDLAGGDAFTEIMREIYQDNSLQKSDKRRNLVKGVVYGKLFGAGVATMAVTAGVAQSQMKTVVDAFNESYPGIVAMQKRIEDIGMRRFRDEGQGYIVNKIGRRLPCDDNRVYSLMNYEIQSDAADVFKKNLVKLDQAEMTQYLIVPVHDEIVFNVPRDEALGAEVMRTVQECMTTLDDGWAVPLTAGADGPFENWGAKYK